MYVYVYIGLHIFVGGRVWVRMYNYTCVRKLYMWTKIYSRSYTSGSLESMYGWTMTCLTLRRSSQDICRSLIISAISPSSVTSDGPECAWFPADVVDGIQTSRS